MSISEDKSNIIKSGSRESLDIQSMDDTAIYSSTRITEENVESFTYKEGRKAMLPESNQKNNEKIFVTNNTETRDDQNVYFRVTKKPKQVLV